ncbi:MAG: glutamate 5-kinase [Nitrososphaerota archaeon]|nr:glutamate 5-kinase [Nitrososphaerota archaeon]MDG6931156.1 glutamate 5-kinase [Nitrososphaerota archaeon]MDG6944662.1 glutamate 5-kinase [Nitrososphaerota archaeon]
MKSPVVVKVGTSVLSTDGNLDKAAIDSIARQASLSISETGLPIVIVTSGAILAGISLLGWNAKPRDLDLTQKQVSAAVGQPILIKMYIDSFGANGLTVAQILITEEDLMIKNCYNNFLHTIESLLRLNIIPIINENDAVSVKELLNLNNIKNEVQFGDNDRLSAIIAKGIGAKKLVLLTDVDGVYMIDGKEKKTLDIIEPNDKKIYDEVEGMSEFGRGGIKSKLDAAFIASSAGIETYIVNGKKEGSMLRAIKGEKVGTKIVGKKQEFINK